MPVQKPALDAQSGPSTDYNELGALKSEAVLSSRTLIDIEEIYTMKPRNLVSLLASRTVPCPAVLFVVVLFSAGGCQTSSVQLSAPQKEIRGALAQIDPRSEDLPGSTPIIDIHSHTFNARYLPLAEILHGKRDAYPPFSWLIGDKTAEVIAQAIIDRTELGAAGDQEAIPRQLHPSANEEQAGFVAKIVYRLFTKAVDAGCWAPDVDLKTRLARVDEMANHMTLTERVAAKTIAKMMGMGDHLDKKKIASEETLSGTQAALRFLWILTQNDAEMGKLYREMHEGVPVAGQIQLVSLMMDLGPVYNQKPDGKNLLNFSTQQIPRMEFFQQQPNANLLYFVAYNPYYDFQPGGRDGDALKIVKDAIAHHGARGVKIYPPSGYRPYGNEIPRRPWTLFTDYPRRQWEARYGSLGPEPGKRLDRNLELLLDWCRENKVPVLTHSGYGEFEARKGYGELHSEPKFWRAYLDTHQEKNGEPCSLRLCLGHAGGGDYWVGTGEHSRWGTEAYEMCVFFPNVYCEITTGDEFVDPDHLAFLVDRLGQLFRESEQDPKKCPYPFAKKLLYGTDWFLPDTAKPSAALVATQRAFLHPLLKPHYKDYFHDNAEAFLRIGAK